MYDSFRERLTQTNPSFVLFLSSITVSILRSTIFLSSAFIVRRLESTFIILYMFLKYICIIFLKNFSFKKELIFPQNLFRKKGLVSENMCGTDLSEYFSPFTSTLMPFSTLLIANFLEGNYHHETSKVKGISHETKERSRCRRVNRAWNFKREIWEEKHLQPSEVTGGIQRVKRWRVLENV